MTDGYANCYDGNKWNETACPDGKTCATNCAIDGADYEATYGITSPSAGALQLKFVTKNQDGQNVGSRVYLMASDDKYRMFNLLNKEFTFDVDVSKLPCGLNGAVYFSEMDEDGGMSKFEANKAGAKYGTGYCDSQCPTDIKFINGEVRLNLSQPWEKAESDEGRKLATYAMNTANIPLSGRLMLRAGVVPITILTPARASMALAVPRWTSGRPTSMLRPTRPIRAR